MAAIQCSESGPSSEHVVDLHHVDSAVSIVLLSLLDTSIYPGHTACGATVCMLSIPQIQDPKLLPFSSGSSRVLRLRVGKQGMALMVLESADQVTTNQLLLYLPKLRNYYDRVCRMNWSCCTASQAEASHRMSPAPGQYLQRRQLTSSV